TSEDPYVQASLKRSIVELYDTCHRLLSFKMLNYDAFVRLIELHCRKSSGTEALSSSSGFGGGGGGSASSSRPAQSSPWSTANMAAMGSGNGGAVREEGGVGGGALSKEKAMKVWL
ncbi:unnamed protein product, partial [Hapterophycus canaliculatus]